MPLKILIWSAALAAGPPTYTFSPALSLLAAFFTFETKPPMSLLKPRSAPTTVWIALWSLDTSGGATRPFTGPSEAK